MAMARDLNMLRRNLGVDGFVGLVIGWGPRWPGEGSAHLGFLKLRELTMKWQFSVRVMGTVLFAMSASIVGCTNGYGDSSDEARVERRRDEDRTTVDAPRRNRDQRIRDAREESAEGSKSVLAYPTGNRATSAILVERISPNEVRMGEPYAYQIKVTNLMNSPLSGVVVRERLPGDFSISRAEPQGRTDGDVRAFELGEIPAKG